MPMETNPRVEPLPRFERFDGGSQDSGPRSGRAKLFGLVFGLTLAIGLIVTFLQPTLYRSSATVLMSAATAIDAEVTEADVQNVAIQRRILLGSDITRRLLADLEDNQGERISASELRALLEVQAVPDTNLVEMSARGANGMLLPIVVNSWIDVYLAVRAQEISRSKTQTLQVVQEELDGLGMRVEQARMALDDYRREHDIISVERQENDVLARLDGLNKALNNAIEEEAKTRANLDTLRQAIARGELVVPSDQQRDVSLLEKELRDLEGQMAELSKRYTPGYIAKQPQLRGIPDRIMELQAELGQIASEGRETELATATQAHAAARQTVTDLQLQLDEHKQEVARFSSIYATHQALAEDLSGLEQLNRDTQARLVKVEVHQVEKYPQVSVVDRPGPDSERIGPDYLLLVGASFGVALALGVFCVWLQGFLSPKSDSSANITLSGVHLYPQEVSGQIGYTTQPNPGLPQDTAPRLEGHGQDPASNTATDNTEK